MPEGFFRVVYRDEEVVDEKDPAAWKVKELKTQEDAAQWLADHPKSAQIRYAVFHAGTNIPFETRESAEAFVAVETKKGENDMQVSRRQPLIDLPQRAIELYYQN